MLDKKLIHILYDKGHGYTDIGKIMGVSKQRIHQIIANYKNYGKDRFNNKEKKKIGDKCKICYEPAVQIHHIDKNNANDSIQNLMPLCLKCHHKVHTGDKRKTKRVRFPELFPKKIKIRKRLFAWSMKYERCIRCKRTSQPYGARGLCKTCAHQNYRKSDHAKEYRRLYRKRESYIQYQQEYHRRKRII